MMLYQDQSMKKYENFRFFWVLERLSARDPVICEARDLKNTLYKSKMEDFNLSNRE